MTENKDVVSWNYVITPCLQARDFVEVVGLFREMLDAGTLRLAFFRRVQNFSC